MTSDVLLSRVHTTPFCLSSLEPEVFGENIPRVLALNCRFRFSEGMSFAGSAETVPEEDPPVMKSPTPRRKSKKKKRVKKANKQKQPSFLSTLGCSLECFEDVALEVDERSLHDIDIEAQEVRSPRAIDIEAQRDDDDARSSSSSGVMTTVLAKKQTMSSSEEDDVDDEKKEDAEVETCLVERFRRRSYSRGYAEPMMATKADIEQSMLFSERDDMLDFHVYAEAMSVPVYASDFCAVVAIWGERGAGRTAFLELLWRALQRRQAEAHAREIAAYMQKTWCWGWANCLAYWRWRRCAPCLVDNGGSGTLHGYYIFCKIECADILSSDRVWGTLLDALTDAIRREYGSWALPYLIQVGARHYPRSGPVFLKFFLWTLLKCALLVVILVFLIIFLLQSNKKQVSKGRTKMISIVGSIVAFYMSSVALMSASVVAMSAAGYATYACKGRQNARKKRAETRAEEEERWRSERSGFHGKAFKELKCLTEMLEVHIRHRKKWPMLLRLCIPNILDGLLPDCVFTCYAWPEVVLSVDDLDKVPSPVAVRLLEALTALSHVEGPVRRSSPFKILTAADPVVLSRGVGTFFEGTASAYGDQQHPGYPQTRGPDVLAESERFLRGFVTIPLELPATDAKRRSRLASKLLSTVGMRGVGVPDDIDDRSCCCCRSRGHRRMHKTMALLVPDTASEGAVLAATTDDDVVLKAPTPRGAVPGHTVINVPLSGESRPETSSLRSAARSSLRTASRYSLPKNCDPQSMARQDWDAAEGHRTSFGGELLPGDVLVFNALAPHLPANPRRLWRVVAVFHIAQRVARHSDTTATSLAWRRSLLRFVLAGERWPGHFGWLRYVLDRLVKHKDSFRGLSANSPETTLVAVYDLVVADLLAEINDDPGAAAVLAIDDGAVVEFRRVLGHLTIAHWLAFERICRNNSSAIAKHITAAAKQAWEWDHATMTSPRCSRGSSTLDSDDIPHRRPNSVVSGPAQC